MENGKMEGYKLRDFPKEEREAFYQEKYLYYRKFLTGMITVSVCAYMVFFFTDCGLMGHFSRETLLPRFIILLPYLGYLLLVKKTDCYKIVVPCTYLMIHLIIFLTDWSTYLLTDRQHAISGMLIMNMIFVCAGFGAPLYMSVIGQGLFVVDIAIAHMFIHYEDLSMMYLFNLPCVIAICVMHHLMEEIALEQHVTKCKLKKLVIEDQLTGVGNRNIFQEIVDDKTKELMMPKGISVGVLLIDIDYFKQVNDEYGHDAGDTVLIYLGKTLKEMIRSADYVIRLGGEEFLLLMPGCDLKQAASIAEKLRKTVETSDNGICPITISVGVSLYTGGNYQVALKQADSAMYDAKMGGRNKVAVYQPK